MAKRPIRTPTRINSRTAETSSRASARPAGNLVVIKHQPSASWPMPGNSCCASRCPGASFLSCGSIPSAGAHGPTQSGPLSSLLCHRGDIEAWPAMSSRPSRCSESSTNVTAEPGSMRSTGVGCRNRRSLLRPDRGGSVSGPARGTQGPNGTAMYAGAVPPPRRGEPRGPSERATLYRQRLQEL